MRLIVLGLAVWAIAATAQAAPRNGVQPTAPTAPWQRVQPAGSGISDGQPFKPYKPYSAYGEGSRSLTPKSGPQYVPGYRPYKPPFRERPGLSGQGGTFDHPQGTF
jgi:hypothetical protein